MAIATVEYTASVSSSKIFGISSDILYSSGVTIAITILGFVITYFMTRKNMKDEILKFKQTSQVNLIQSLPFELCELMDNINNKGCLPELQKKYAEIMNKVLAYWE